MKILVTGSAGFIGFHVTQRLLKNGHQVVGFDNLNSYYNPQLKYDRLAETGIPFHKIIDARFVESTTHSGYRFIKMDLTQKGALMDLFRYERFDTVIHLAAQAGVRYSIENPSIYVKSNIEGFLNILEACRHYPVTHLIYASSSSVYGNNKKVPFSIDDRVDNPVSLYAATKKSNELMAYTYSHLFKIPTTGLRFFTVYGPWGRPDMAPSLFTDAIINNRSINVFNNGNMERDFTYIDDIVEGITRISQKIPISEPEEKAPYTLHNIGNSNPIKLMDFITSIEKNLNTKAKKTFLPMQPGDVQKTYADINSLTESVAYSPCTRLDDGVKKFIDWYISYIVKDQFNNKKKMTV
ncbi:NAD-dependent epimerase [Aquimarina sp. RZ0]|uniref:NAD-dependent epimerase n=1 Tax=Aquimarina sp. RZ0 TaxID=2607730 RepID=UPI0011F0E048|nr:NAD-dependent epimerase [Aquimarina sp. RZ0]KAA1245272.1 NAD-dependent epimerase [Aquimarina sp. RZ0]